MIAKDPEHLKRENERKKWDDVVETMDEWEGKVTDPGVGALVPWEHVDALKALRNKVLAHRENASVTEAQWNYYVA